MHNFLCKTTFNSAVNINTTCTYNIYLRYMDVYIIIMRGRIPYLNNCNNIIPPPLQVHISKQKMTS